MHTDPPVSLSLARFLLLEDCPAAWRGLDLYLFRDDQVAFYVGQSHLAFARVWDHLLGGFKGHSPVGRFVWSNWPVSLRFTIELLSAASPRFDDAGNQRNAAERALIRDWSPCFNISQNLNPTPLPAIYRPWNAPLRCPRSLRALTYQAARAVQAEDHALLLRELDEAA